MHNIYASRSLITLKCTRGSPSTSVYPKSNLHYTLPPPYISQSTYIRSRIKYSWISKATNSSILYILLNIHIIHTANENPSESIGVQSESGAEIQGRHARGGEGGTLSFAEERTDAASAKASALETGAHVRRQPERAHPVRRHITGHVQQHQQQVSFLYIHSRPAPIYI